MTNYLSLSKFRLQYFTPTQNYWKRYSRFDKYLYSTILHHSIASPFVPKTSTCTVNRTPPASRLCLTNAHFSNRNHCVATKSFYWLQAHVARNKTKIDPFQPPPRALTHIALVSNQSSMSIASVTATTIYDSPLRKTDKKSRSQGYKRLYFN